MRHDMVITSDMIRTDFESTAEELKRRREELEEVETFAYSARISGYGRLTGRPAEKADRSEIRMLALERRRRAIAQLEQQLEVDIVRITGGFKGWKEGQQILRLRYVQGMSVDEAAEMVFGLRRSGCDNWSCYRQRAFRLERRAFEEIARQVR